MNVQLVRSSVSVWSLGAAVTGLLVNAFGLGIVWSNLNNQIVEGAARDNRMDTHLVAIDTRLAPFETAMFRLQTVETTVPINNKNLNDRMDRIVDSLGGKIDALTQSTNNLAADVKVLLSQKKAELEILPPSLAAR